MRPSEWRELARLAWRRGDGAYRGAIAGAALAERLLGPATVHFATAGSFRLGLAFGGSAAAVLLVRRLLQSKHVGDTEAALYVSAVRAVFQQDVLRHSVLEGEEALVAMFDGVKGVAGLLADTLPTLGANIVASMALLVLILATQPLAVSVVALCSGAIAITFVRTSRRAWDSARAGETSAWVNLADSLWHAFQGRLEIVGAGRADLYSERFEATVSTWQVAHARAVRWSQLAGRVPLAVAALCVGGAVVVEGLARGEPLERVLARGLFLASIAPAFFGLLQGVREVVRSDRRVAEMNTLLGGELPRPSSRRAPTAPSLVELKDVRFSYDAAPGGREALRGVSFAWRAGEVLGIAGPNGSGKSTCLRAILGLGRHVRGQVVVDGAPLDALDVEAWRRSISFFTQRPYLPPRTTVRAALRFLDPALEDEAMIRALDRLGIADTGAGPAAAFLDVRVDDLSVGQRQRVALARALCRGARVFVLDEPDANLDAAGVRLLAALLREVSREGMVVFAAHSPDLLAAADRVITLREGALAPP